MVKQVLMTEPAAEEVFAAGAEVVDRRSGSRRGPAAGLVKSTRTSMRPRLPQDGAVGSRSMATLSGGQGAQTERH